MRASCDELSFEYRGQKAVQGAFLDQHIHQVMEALQANLVRETCWSLHCFISQSGIAAPLRPRDSKPDEDKEGLNSYLPDASKPHIYLNLREKKIRTGRFRNPTKPQQH